MIKHLPVEIPRYISRFLLVHGCLNLELCIQRSLFDKEHYEKLLYKEEYKHAYTFKEKEIFIETCRIGNAVYSTVRVAMRSFIIRHTDDISTREANGKAFAILQDREKKVLRHRLEMVGFYE